MYSKQYSVYRYRGYRFIQLLFLQICSFVLSLYYVQVYFYFKISLKVLKYWFLLREIVLKDYFVCMIYVFDLNYNYCYMICKGNIMK